MERWKDSQIERYKWIEDWKDKQRARGKDGRMEGQLDRKIQMDRRLERKLESQKLRWEDGRIVRQKYIDGQKIGKITRELR